MRFVLAIALWCYCTLLVGADETAALRRRATATAPAGRILKLRLINADTDQPITAFDPLLPYSLINVGALPTSNLNIEAVTEGDVGSIQWSFGSFVRDENWPRWSFCGNAGSDFYQCSDTLKVGANATLTGTPYSAKYANGTRFPSYSINVAIISATAPTGPTNPQLPTKAPVAPTKAPIAVAPPAAAAPVSPPVSAPLSSIRLLNVTLISPSTLNVSAGSVAGRMQIVAQDDKYGISRYSVRAVRTVLGEGNTYIQSSSNDVSPVVVGKPSNVVADLSFFSFLRNGNYLLEVYLENNSGSSIRILPAEMSQRGFASQLTVVGSTAMTGYLLSFVSNSPTTVDISSTAASFSFTAKLNPGPYVITTDSMSFVAESSFGSFDIYFASQSDSWDARTFHLFRQIDQPRPGVYSLRLRLTLQGVLTEYMAADLEKLGFPSTITITQSSPFTPPVTPPRRRVVIPPGQI